MFITNSVVSKWSFTASAYQLLGMLAMCILYFSRCVCSMGGSSGASVKLVIWVARYPEQNHSMCFQVPLMHIWEAFFKRCKMMRRCPCCQLWNTNGKWCALGLACCGMSLVLAHLHTSWLLPISCSCQASDASGSVLREVLPLPWCHNVAAELFWKKAASVVQCFKLRRSGSGQ